MNLTEIQQNKVKKYAEIMAIATVEYAYRDQNVKWAELSGTIQFSHIQNCMPAAEAIVKHLQSLVPQDVDNDIEKKFPNIPSMQAFDYIQGLRREAARYGVSLADRKKAIAFVEWCESKYTYVQEGMWDGADDETYRTEQLYEIFEVEYLKNTKQG